MEFRLNGVSERDMDLLFLEELAVNRDFLELFLRKTGNAALVGYEIVSGELSLADAVLGESDLTVILEGGGQRAALLIEDKIHAIAQPRQYERYVERGQKGIREKHYDAFYVFLVAPADYCRGNDSAEKYPLRVTYEECRALLAAGTDVRSRLKYQQISEAIGQGRRPYTKIADAASTAFWDSYVRYMQLHYPDIALRSRAREKSRNGDWPTYQTSLDMKAVYIHHKMSMKGVEYSYIDLTFNGLAAHREELKALLKEMLGEGYLPQFGLHRAGGSAVLRLVAPRKLDWQLPFEEQLDAVEEHLRLVETLRQTAAKIDKERLLAFYAEAAPDRLQ